MTKILALVDLAQEESRERVVAEAVREARLRDAELHLLAVVPDFGSVLVSEHFPSGFERDVLEKAHARLQELMRRIPDEIRSEAHIGHGHPAEEILGWADRLEVDLIVMTAHRPDALRSLFVGSLADKIVHNASQSVLVVRE